ATRTAARRMRVLAAVMRRPYGAGAPRSSAEDGHDDRLQHADPDHPYVGRDRDGRGRAHRTDDGDGETVLGDRLAGGVAPKPLEDGLGSHRRPMGSQLPCRRRFPVHAAVCGPTVSLGAPDGRSDDTSPLSDAWASGPKSGRGTVAPRLHTSATVPGPGRHACALIVAVAVLGVLPPARAATFTVTPTADDGPGSLRQAIVDANADAVADTIAFAIATGGIPRIMPLSALPAITQPVTIDGTTQLPAGWVELDGEATLFVPGLTLAR